MELLERCRRLLRSGDFNEYSQLIAPDRLTTLRHEIEANLTPATRTDVAKAVAMIGVTFKIPGSDVLNDLAKFSKVMIDDLYHARYSAGVLNDAIRHARRTIKWLPSIAEIVEICDELVGERRSWLCAIDRMMDEHLRRRKKAEREAERAAEQERDRRRREEQAARIRALHGDAVAVSPEEIELATYLRPIMRWPIGKLFPWHESLDRGELWAVKHCRRLALAEQAKRAEAKKLIPAGEAAAIAKLAMVDEPAARSRVDALPSLQALIVCQEDPDFSAAISEIEAAAWAERGIFEGDLTLPGPLVENERFGPTPDATLDFTEDPQQTAAELRRAKELFRAQKPSSTQQKESNHEAEPCRQHPDRMDYSRPSLTSK